MTPYYDRAGVTIYCGDARDILPSLVYDTIITDPVWPNATVPLYGSDDPAGMFASVMVLATSRRLAVHLGCDSDPRFLLGVPPSLPFFRIVTLEIANVGYKGRLLMNGDTAYLFGTPPRSKPGQHLIPGRCMDADPFGKQADHPCPRKLGHVAWLVNWWSEPEDVILDPFAGSLTTAVAAKKLGRRVICIEAEERFCAAGVQRLSQDVLSMEFARGAP